MVSTPHWVRPAVAAVTIAAVGAASIVIGTAFAPPTTNSAPATAELPVLQPIGYGDTAPWLDSDGDPGTGELSPVQAIRTVPLGADGLPDPGREFADAVDRLTDSDDPDASGFDFDVVGDSDDPCAPAEGPAVEGCPDGIHGAVFALVAPDALWVRGSASHEPSADLPDYAVQCASVEHEATALPFGFVSNAPGTIVMRYWPRGDAGSAVTVDVTTPAAATAAWETGLAESDAFEGDWTVVNSCTVLEGLVPHQAYEFEYTMTDILDRTFTNDFTLPFSLPDDRTVPPTYIRPLGTNAVMLSAPHTDRVRVNFNVQVVDEGETADCTLQGDRLPSVDGEFAKVIDVSPEFLADNGYLPQYTKRTSISILVPEGSTIVACIAESDHDRPGWEWLEAQRHAWRVLQTPDSARPIVSVDSVALLSEVEADSLSVSALWPNNQGYCHLWTGPESAGRTVDGGFDAACGDESEHAITQDDAIIQSSVRYDGVSTNSSFVLPLSGLACLGTCALPPTVWYSVPLSIEGGEVEMCGSGMRAPCDPADAVGAVGTATLRVDWVQGASNGRATWEVGDLLHADVEHVLDPLPQMDWTVRPTVAIDDSARSATVSFPLRADRPVTYSVTMSGDCERPNAAFTQSGNLLAGGTASINLPGACLGLWYDITVVLTDGDGNTSTFGLGTGTAHWPDARVRTPGILTGVYLWYHVSLEESAYQTKIVQLRVSVDDQEIDPLLPEGGCFPGTGFGHRAGGPLLPDAVITERVTIEITMQLAVGYGSTDGVTARCDAGWDESPVYTMTAVVDPDELGRQVTISAPDDAPYFGEFTLGRVPAEE